MPGRPSALVFLLCASLWACGYTVVRADAVPGGQALRVAPFVNKTALAEAGGWCAQAARQALLTKGRLASESSTGPVLRGELKTLRSAASALGAGGVAALRVEVELGLRIEQDQALLYADVATGGEDYPAGVDVTESEANRRAAIRRLVERVLGEAIERMQVASVGR